MFCLDGCPDMEEGSQRVPLYPSSTLQQRFRASGSPTAFTVVNSDDPSAVGVVGSEGS